LVLLHKCDGDEAALVAETPSGYQKELVVNNVGREAIAFAASKASFDVRELPGGLTDDERLAMGEALEETGLFRRL
jgi:hypothetical protein